MRLAGFAQRPPQKGPKLLLQSLPQALSRKRQVPRLWSLNRRCPWPQKNGAGQGEVEK